MQLTCFRLHHTSAFSCVLLYLKERGKACPRSDLKAALRVMFAPEALTGKVPLRTSNRYQRKQNHQSWSFSTFQVCGFIFLLKNPLFTDL